MFEPDAPDFKTASHWINSSPIRIMDLRKKVVLVDFWTYSCINCVHTLPHIKTLQEKYGDKGLVIIGVHTPEFEFERNVENVEAAVEKYGITYPVAMDNDNRIWQTYGNRYWPRRALVNYRGKIMLEQVGEDGFDELEAKIVELLAEIGVQSEPVDGKRTVSKEERMKIIGMMQKRTPEIYLGWERSQGFCNSAVCVPGSCNHFVDGREHKEHVPFLSGDWTQEKEYLKHGNDEEGYIGLRFTARSVNAVIHPKGARKFKVYVAMDNKPLDRSVAGRDIKMDREGRSYIEVDKPDMYELVEMERMGTYEIKLTTDSPDFSIYTFTFS